MRFILFQTNRKFLINGHRVLIALAWKAMFCLRTSAIIQEEDIKHHEFTI